MFLMNSGVRRSSVFRWVCTFVVIFTLSSFCETSIAIVKVNKAVPEDVIKGIARDIEAITGFIPVEKYSAQQDIMEGEFGSFAGVRFISTTQAPEFLGGGATGGSNVKETGGKADVYATFIFGEDAYGEVPLSGQSSAVIIKAPSAGDTTNTSDPLNQRSTAGWKAMYAFKILNDLWIERIEHAVSA